MTIPHIGRRAFPIDSIAQAWRPSNYCRTGFLVGAGIGAGTSVLLSGIARSLTYERYTASDAIKVGTVGALVLGSIGYIIGGFVPGWRDIYHR